MITKSEEFGNCGNKIHSNFGENAFDRVNVRGNYRIASMEYNALTGELTINQYPDVSKTIVLGDSSVSRNNSTSHKDVIEEILDWASMSIDDFNNLKKDKNYVIYNANNPESERYLYYTYSKATGEWVSSILVEGDEFFNTTDSIKYRYENNKLVNTIDVLLTARNTVIDGKSTGITLEVSPTTGDSVHLDLVGEQYAGLMSPEDKYKLDNIGGKIGSVLELGNPTEGKVPLYLKSEDGQVLSMVNLDEDDYIDNIVASIATEDVPDNGIHIGDRIMTFTLTNGVKLIISLEGWFLKYRGLRTDSIDLSIVENAVKASLIINPNVDNLSKITSEGLLTTLDWQDTTSKIDNNPVKFLKGTKGDYSNSAHSGYIYFATDTKEIIVDSIAYGLDITASNLRLVEKIESTASVGEFLVTNSNKSTYLISIPVASGVTNGLLNKTDKVKLDTIEEYSQINKLEGIKIGNNTQTITNKIAVLDTYTKSEINSKTDSGMHYRGESISIGTIPTEGRQTGDTRKITSEKIGLATGASVYWDGTSWVTFTGSLDLSEYATKEDLGNQSSSDLSEVNKKLERKVDKEEGKGLVLDTEIDKLLYLDTYIKDISETIVEGKINLNVTKRNPSSKGTETIGQIVLSDSNSTHNGLMSSKHYNVIESLQSSDNYLDKTGTPSSTWQLSKNNGPKIKNSGGEFDLRNSADDDYTGLTVKNLTITGNVTQLGCSFITEAETVEVVDNTILLNKGEVGAGVTKGYAGIEVDRGTLPQYNIYFDESDDRFKAGVTGEEQPIMLRDSESNLLNENILIWDSSTKLAKTSKNLDTELNKYLPLAGGIMSSGARVQLSGTSGLTRGDSNEGFMITPTEVSSGGYNNTLMIVTDGSNNNLQHINGGTPYKVWDEFNDGTGSGLDADLLDGKHASEFALTTSIPAELSLGESSTTAYRGDRGKIAYDYAIGQRSIQDISGLEGMLDDKLGNTGNQTINGNLALNTPDGSYINFSRNGENKGYVGCGATATTDVYLLNYGSGGNIKIADNGKNYSNGNEIATVDQIPTQTSQLTNNSGFITSSSLNGYATQSWVGSNCVTLGDTQTITGTKTFTSAVTGTLGFYDTSDVRLKTNIKEIELKSEKINLYEFDKEGNHSYGVIAQEVEELYPSTVKENGGGYKVVNYNEILTIKCAELETENKVLKDRLDKLEQLLMRQGIL